MGNACVRAHISGKLTAGSPVLSNPTGICPRDGQYTPSPDRHWTSSCVGGFPPIWEADKGKKCPQSVLTPDFLTSLRMGDWSAAPWPQPCQAHQWGWEPNTRGYLLGMFWAKRGGEDKIFCMSWVVKHFPGFSGKRLVRMFRVKPMQGTGPRHHHKAVLLQGWGSIPGAGLLALYRLSYTNPKHTNNPK